MDAREQGQTQGSASLSKINAHSGQFSVKLEPNSRIASWDQTHDPLAVGQGFRAGPLRGRKLYVSGWLAAEGEAAAALDVVALGGRTPALAELKQTSAKSGPVYREDVLLVPDEARQFLGRGLCASKVPAERHISMTFLSAPRRPRPRKQALQPLVLRRRVRPSHWKLRSPSRPITTSGRFLELCMGWPRNGFGTGTGCGMPAASL